MTASDESVLKLKSPAEVTSGDADVVFPTGSYVECLTALETTYSGQVLRFDAPSRMLVIKDSSGVKPVMRFINLAFVREVNTRERPTEFTPYTIQLPSIEQLNERIRCSEELKRVSIMQAHVSLEGQRAFISLQKILGDVRWEGECIIVLGRIRVNPPYSADSVEATLDAASSRSVRAKEHVCKILLKLTRAQLSSSSENVKSDADQLKLYLSFIYQEFATVNSGKAFRGLVDVRLAKRHFQKTYSAIRLISTELVDYEMVKKEVWYLRWLSHPNIISIEEVFTIGPDVYILTPFYNLGSILFVIQTHCKFGLPEKAIAKIFKCLLSAVLYLHEQEIVHRSIRCSHILLSSTGEVKLSGLRNCAFVKRNQLTGVKSVLNDHSDNLMDGLLWLAPEVLKQDVHGYGVVSDVYSIGITLCEMANGFPPFFDMDQLQMLYEKEKGTTPRLLDRTTLKNSGVEVSQYQRLNRSFSVNFHNLTELCLRPDPETRPSVQKLRSHPFFRSMKRNRTFASLVPHITPIEPEEAQTLIDSESRVLSSSSFEWIFEN